MLLDEGSFEEYDMFKEHRCHNFGMEKKQFLGDGVVAGSGTIDGRLIFIFAQDFTVHAGSLSETMSQKICKVMDMAMKMGAPVIGINDSGGARIQEGINALAGYAEIFERNILASGVIPQISGIFGPCAGGAVYSPALTDFTLMMENTSYMFLTGPKVVKTVTGEDIDQEHLGGASVHATKSGVTHFTAATEEEGLQMLKTLLSYIPSNNMETAPYKPTDDPINRMEDSLNEIIPENPNEAYDMYKVISAITDDHEFFEVQPKFAKNIIVGFARFNGVYNAVILHGAQLLYAYGEATVPKITVTLRKSYGGSHIVMGSKQLHTDLNYAWPSAEIAVMGASGAAAVLYAKEAKAKKEAGEDVKAFIAEKEPSSLRRRTSTTSSSLILIRQPSMATSMM